MMLEDFQKPCSKNMTRKIYLIALLLGSFQGPWAMPHPNLSTQSITMVPKLRTISFENFGDYCKLLNNNVTEFLNSKTKVQEFLQKWKKHVPPGTLRGDNSGLERHKAVLLLKQMLRSCGMDETFFKEYLEYCFRNQKSCDHANNYLNPLLNVRRKLTESNKKLPIDGRGFEEIIPELKSTLDDLILEIKWKKDLCNHKKYGDFVVGSLRALWNESKDSANEKEFYDGMDQELDRMVLKLKETIPPDPINLVQKNKKPQKNPDMEALKKIRLLLQDVVRQKYYGAGIEHSVTERPFPPLEDSAVREFISLVDYRIHDLKNGEEAREEDTEDYSLPQKSSLRKESTYGTILKSKISSFLQDRKRVSQFLKEWNTRYKVDQINKDEKGFLFLESVHVLKNMLSSYVNFHEEIFDHYVDHCLKNHKTFVQGPNWIDPIISLRKEISEPMGKYYQGGTHNGLRSAFDAVILEMNCKKDFCNKRRSSCLRPE